ncbi:MAG: hypothetical protein MUF84_17835, partial [Anaerolineae bacterium]|nr:hypothetical protein [Anaerolineae bacterium]
MVALLLAAPVLWFPEEASFLTVISLALLSVVWLMRLFRHDPVPVTPLNGALLLWVAMVAVGMSVTAFPVIALPKATGIVLGLATWVYLVRLGVRGVPAPVAVVGLAALGFGVASLGLLMTDWPAKVPLLSVVLAHLPPVLLRVPGAPDAGVHANELAGAVAPFVPLALSLILSGCATDSASQRRRWPAGVLIALGVASLVLAVLSQSRSAWLGVVGGCAAVAALWAWLSPSRRLAWGLRLALFTGLAGVVAAGLWLGED